MNGKDAQKAKAWDLWLDCKSEREIAEVLSAAPNTIGEWVAQKSNELENCAPASRQHFDIWNFAKADGELSYFGRPWSSYTPLDWRTGSVARFRVDPASVEPRAK